MSEASARTLLENLEIDTLARIVANLGTAVGKLLDGRKEPDPMLCQDLNDLRKIATDVYCQHIKETQ